MGKYGTNNDFFAKSGRFLDEQNRMMNLVDHLKRGTNQFNEVKVAQNVTQIALNNNLPLSSFRDKQEGNVTKQGPEYRVRADGSNNTSVLRTALRGNYISGHVLTPGIGIRIPTMPTGDQFGEWGYYEYDGNLDPLNGTTFRQDSQNLLLNLYSNGINQLGIPRAEWNQDPMDGTGPSGIDLTVSTGYVYRLPFVYYGYGPALFTVGIRNMQGFYGEYPIHEADIDGAASLPEPNLPLTATAYNGGDSSTFDVFVGGRQISVSGPDKAVEPRQVGWEVENKTVGETITPILAFQHKTGRENIRVRMKDFRFEADKDIYLYLYRNFTLDGGTTTYTTPIDYDSNETATEWNRAATSFSDGERFGGVRYVPVGSGGNASGASGGELPGSELIEEENWCVAGRTKASAGAATVSGYCNLNEDW